MKSRPTVERSGLELGAEVYLAASSFALDKDEVRVMWIQEV